MSKPRPRTVVKMNPTLEVIGRVSFNDAVADIVMGDARPYEVVFNEFVHGPPNEDGERVTIPWPVSIVMNNYVYIDPKYIHLTEREATYSAIFQRDSYECQYNTSPIPDEFVLKYGQGCDGIGKTIDHVQPQSRGGANSWLNLVACCNAHNAYKADRTPEEAGLWLVREPFQPDANRFMAEQKRVWKLLETGEVDWDD